MLLVTLKNAHQTGRYVSLGLIFQIAFKYRLNWNFQECYFWTLRMFKF